MSQETDGADPEQISVAFVMLAQFVRLICLYNQHSLITVRL